MNPPEVGYLMISSFEIHKYRCFSEASAKNLSRINIIVGQSGTGKTALLEALFLCAGGSPQHYFNLLKWRGVIGDHLAIESGAYDQFFRDMFHKFDVANGVKLRIEDSERGAWSLDIGPTASAQKQLVSPGTADSAVYTPISFSSKSGSGKDFEATIRLAGEGSLQFPPAPEPYPITFLNNVTLAHPAQGAGRFSQIVQDAKEATIIRSLNQLYGDIDDVRLVSYGGINVLLASVVGLGRIPISSVSGGVNKYLTILITIGNKGRNVVLIDEIENGFYYANMTGAWRGIAEACRETNSQIFVTTHSLECLRALLPLLEEHAEPFTLIRTERMNKEIVLVQFAGSELRDAIEHGFEIR
jgi:hypothetical protein